MDINIDNLLMAKMIIYKKLIRILDQEVENGLINEGKIKVIGEYKPQIAYPQVGGNRNKFLRINNMYKMSLCDAMKNSFERINFVLSKS